MTDMTEAAWLWVAKGAGAIAGSAISIAYVLPSGRREAAIRFAVGIAAGLVYGGAAGVKIAAELGIGDSRGGEPVRVVGGRLRHPRLRNVEARARYSIRKGQAGC